MGSWCALESCGGSSTDSSSEQELEDAVQAIAPGPHEQCRRRCRIGVPAVALVLLGGLGFVFHAQICEAFTVLLAVVGRLGWISVVIVTLMVAFMVVLMLPTFPLVIGATIEFTKVFGMRAGIAASLCSSFGGLWLGSVIAFQLGRTLWRDQARKHSTSREADSEVFRVINRMIEEEGAKIVFLARMSPLLPCEVFNYACSVTSLTLREWVVGCMGSIVPIGFWVVTTAQATHAADGSSHHHHNMENVAFVAFNVTLLVALTAMMYLSYIKYRDAERDRDRREASAAYESQLLKVR
mmetsp:Transcript_41598/g.109813  ORF Transcript_41598/g.109813 Transcript_41598/m.109813 type:complete len:296 (-) Transcript_41598:29-916(-)